MTSFRILILCLSVSLTSCDWIKQKFSAKSEKPGLHLFEHVSVSDNFVASVGDLRITAEDMQDMELAIFEDEKREVEFALMYAQGVSYSKEIPKEFVFSGTAFARDYKNILNQYGIPLKETAVKFVPSQNKAAVAVVDGKTLTASDINQEHYLLGAVNTKIYRRRRAIIYNKAKNYFLNLAAKKQNIPIQEFVEKKVLVSMNPNVSEEETKAQIKKLGLKEGQAGAAKEQILGLRKQKYLNYYVEKFLIPLPIKLNFPKPQYFVKSELPSTPHFIGSQEDLEIVLFSDTQSSVSVDLLSRLPQIFKKYGKEVKVLYRPVFFEANIMQRIVVQGLLCNWLQDPKKFWGFLPNVIGDLKDESEKIMIEKAPAYVSSIDQFRKCIIEKKSDSLIKYHLDYAKYLGITAGPVVYIGGEIWYGNITGELLESLVAEHLGYADAGLW